MKKLPLLVCLVLAAALVAVWSMDQRTKAELQQRSEALRQAQATLEDLRAENDRIKNQIAQTGSAGGEQISELLKLRAEVARLRQSANELKALRAQNEQLRQSATVAAEPRQQTTNPPPDVPPQDIHPRETWNFVGYGSPDATVQSMLWGATHTNREAFLAGFDTEMRSQIESNFPDDEASFREKMSSNTGFRVVDRKSVSDDEMDLTLYLDGDGNQETTRFKRINGEWKVVK